MNDSNDSDAIAELLTLIMEVDQWGDRIYRNPMGQLHRVYGPALECANGTRRWYLNGNIHRTDGPAAEYADGHKAWWLNDKLHRTDGPAIELANGDTQWFLNGKCLTEREFHDRLK